MDVDDDYERGSDEEQQETGVTDRGDEELADMLVKEAMAAAEELSPENLLIILPGDDVVKHIQVANQGHTGRVKLGPGLVQNGQSVIATRAGTLRHKGPLTWWIDSNQRRYTPRVEDHVLGIVEDRSVESYRVNIYGHCPAVLPILAFDGATKRNKPNLKAGVLVYCRIVSASKDLEPELSCMAIGMAVKKDWATHQGTFGELVGGLNARCSVMQARSLMQPQCLVLNAIGRELPFEIAVGANGAFWVNSKGGTRTTTAIVNAILNASVMPDSHKIAMVEKVLHELKSGGKGE